MKTDTTREGTYRRLTDEQVIQEIARRQDIRFLHGKKWQILLGGGVLGGLFVLFFPFIIYATGGASLWPLAPAVLLAVAWALFIGFGHRSISWSDFEALPKVEQERRLYYESMWARLFQGGFALFASAAMLWGAVLIGRSVSWESWEEALLLVGYTALILFLWVRRAWVMRVAVEGSDAHRWLKPTLGVLLSLPGIASALAIVGRIQTATGKQEYSVRTMGPLLAPILIGYSALITIYGMVALFIARSQYQLWRNMKGSSQTEAS